MGCKNHRMLPSVSFERLIEIAEKLSHASGPSPLNSLSKSESAWLVAISRTLNIPLSPLRQFLQKSEIIQSLCVRVSREELLNKGQKEPVEISLPNSVLLESCWIVQDDIEIKWEKKDGIYELSDSPYKI